MMILFTKDFQAGLGLPQKLESLYCLPVKIPTGMITHPSIKGVNKTNEQTRNLEYF